MPITQATANAASTRPSVRPISASSLSRSIPGAARATLQGEGSTMGSIRRKAVTAAHAASKPAKNSKAREFRLNQSIADTVDQRLTHGIVLGELSSRGNPVWNSRSEITRTGRLAMTKHRMPNASVSATLCVISTRVMRSLSASSCKADVISALILPSSAEKGSSRITSFGFQERQRESARRCNSMYRKNKNPFQKWKASVLRSESLGKLELAGRGCGLSVSKRLLRREWGTAVLWGGWKNAGVEPARATTVPLDSADRPKAWIDRGYQQGDLSQNTCAGNSANATFVDEGVSLAPAVQKEQPMSCVVCGVQTARNGASRVGSGLAHVRPELQRTPQSSNGSSRPAFPSDLSSKTRPLDP